MFQNMTLLVIANALVLVLGANDETPEGVGSADFLEESGRTAVVYAGLTVRDADGEELAAGFERVGDGLVLSVDEHGARYPLTIDPLAEQAILKASNAESNDIFGFALGVSGDTVVVGAPGEDSPASGVNGDQGNGLEDAGAAYVFVRNESGWSQQAYLKASNPDSTDYFGESVSISGDTVAIAARQEDSSATGVNGAQGDAGPNFDSGAVYVFVRNGTTWSQQAYIKASNAEATDWFGTSVSVSGDTLVVGATQEDSSATGVNGDEDDDSAPESGAAYVFVRSGTSWSQQAYLKASNAELLDRFGERVSISGDTLAVSSMWEKSGAAGVNGDQSDNGTNGAGAVYVFVRSGTSWSQQAYLKASNPDVGDFFGSGLSVSCESPAQDTILVSAVQEDSNATGVNGDEDDDTATMSGAAYVFGRSGTSWSQQAYLKASNTEDRDRFGSDVSVWGDTLVVGAEWEDSNATGVNGNQGNNSALTSGAAYVFVREGTSWSQHAYLKASNTEAGDAFGGTLSLSCGTAVIASWGEDSLASESGAVYVIEVGVPAQVAFRNSGSNPASYMAAPVVIGGNFTATVDNALAGQLTSVLFALEATASFPLAGGQTLLCLDLGSGELFTGAGLAPASSLAGVDTYGLAVPNDAALCGLALHSQAIQFGSPPFVLSNAQDLSVGTF